MGYERLLSKHDLVLRKILADVQRPSRYIGTEWNCAEKGDSRASIALAYPDVYEVGMSNLGLQILYDVINSHEGYSCERVFAPWPDMEEQMLKNELPLFTLESRKSVKKGFDIFGFSLQYELTFTNVLKMLKLAGIPLRADERDENSPLVIGGGPCVFNPEPMAPFFDLFVIGEAEEAIIEIMDIIADQKQAGASGFGREETIDSLSKLKSVYVPKSSVGKDAIKKRSLSDFNRYSVPRAPVVPFMETIHDRCVIEVMRGCTRGCRFCQAGIIYRPTRERGSQKVLEGAAAQSRSTGHEDISLASLSTTDHSQIMEMLDGLMEISRSPGSSVSLPSLRCDQFSVDVAQRIVTKKKRGLTFAPEAGTARLRKVINKGLTEEQILETTTKAFKMGWSRIKLYFMIGLPTETDEDILGITDLVKSIMEAAAAELGQKAGNRVKLSVSVSTFVPKSHTPFQWMPMLGQDEVERRQALLRDNLKSRRVDLKWHASEGSIVEAALAKGGRGSADAIENAYKLGAGFDSWAESFSYNIWERAYEMAGLDLVKEAARSWGMSEALPWDHIESGVTKEWLKREYTLAEQGLETPDCREGQCSQCGVCVGDLRLEIADGKN